MNLPRLFGFILPMMAAALGVVGGYLVVGGPPSRTGANGALTVPISVQKTLMPLRAARSQEERMRATVHLARGISTSGISDWLDQPWYPYVDKLEGMVFERILMERFLEEDPKCMASWCQRECPDELTRVIWVWSGRDPEAAVGWLWQIQDREELKRLLPVCFDAVARRKPLFALSQVPVIEARVGEPSPPWLVAVLGTISREHRENVVKEAEKWPEPLRILARCSLHGPSIAGDFPAEIERLKLEPGGMDRFMKSLSDPAFAAKALEHAAIIPKAWLSAAALSAHAVFLTKDADPAFWLNVDLSKYGLSDTLASKLADLGMSSLINRDPERAVRLLKRDDLRETDRRKLLGEGFARLATRNPWIAIECLADLSDPREIVMAKSTIAETTRVILPRRAARVDLNTQQWLAVFASERGMSDGEAKQAMEWNALTNEELRKGFAALPKDQKHFVALRCVMFDSSRGEHVRGDSSALARLRADGIAHYLLHEKAINEKWGRADNRRERAIVRFGVSLALEDPVSASRWAQEELPLGEMRLTIMKNVAACWQRFDPASSNRWVRSLPDGELVQIEEFLRPNR